MNKLTQRQSEVLAFVKSHIEETGYPPTRADIAKELGFKSANAAEEHLKALARKGAIEMIPGTSRGIKLPESLGLPIIGRVAAGHPILAEAHIEDHCEIPPAFFNPAADYMLIVRGDSMIECGIFDGDLLAVHSTPTAREGDIVVPNVGPHKGVKHTIIYDFGDGRYNIQPIGLRPNQLCEITRSSSTSITTKYYRLCYNN